MPVAVITTVGSASANAYASSDFITDYSLGTAFAAAWRILSNEQRDVRNVWATRVLDTLPFPGRPVSLTQARQFPRYDIESPSGYCYDSASIPTPILRAHAHLACYLATFDDAADPFVVDDKTNIKRKKTDVLETEYFANAGTSGNRFLSAVISPLLRPWGLLGPSGAVRLTR